MCSVNSCLQARTIGDSLFCDDCRANWRRFVAFKDFNSRTPDILIQNGLKYFMQV